MYSKFPICAFRQNKRSKWIAGVAFGLLIASSVAEATQINFDDVADGTIINTHYAGVTFTNPIGGNLYARATASAPSAPNVASLFGSGLPGFDAPFGAVDVYFAS